jgi:hypothetical protein
MDAFILHAEGDEAFAQDMALRIAPATSLDAPLAHASAYAFGEHLFVLALWSARAEVQGLGRQLADTVRNVGDRCIVVRLDGTPLPAIAGAAQVASIHGRENDFAAMLKVARLRARPAVAPAPVRQSGGLAGGIGPGVGVGLAIYAGMFVAAGAWRSEDITQAIETNAQTPAVATLRSFQTAFDAPETAHVALASAEPNARFVQPQRVILTASADTAAGYPVVVAQAADAIQLAPVEAAPPAPVVKPTPIAPVAEAPVDLSGVGATSLSLIALDGVSTLDVLANETF